MNNNLKPNKNTIKEKREYAKEHNIELLEIWYYDYDNIENILENKIKELKERLNNE